MLSDSFPRIPIRQVGILSKPGIGRASTLVADLVSWLKKRSITARYDSETAFYLDRDDGLPRDGVPDGTQLIIVLGGDGTLLSAARAVAGREIPIFAVNLGGLGFLTAITIEQIFPELERALNGEQGIASRRMLRCEILRDGVQVGFYEALNDVVVTKSSIARMIDMEAHVDNHYVCTYKADGLIVSTPTGSTAYSLSAGGPIMFPALSALCITPICPHMLTNRPVLVPDTCVIQIVSLAQDTDAYLTIDGQVGQPLVHEDRILCRSSSHSIHLIQPPKMLFFDVLREKLKWGER
ncbi:MAG: NAD(+)/NADH kinase [Acidobacteriaceae bacterium]|nr:NAD(+)/NADH kinase [Acidobacteriaceae bacterium]